MKLQRKKERLDDYGEATSWLNEGLVFKDSQITGCGNMKISCLVEVDIDIEGDISILYSGVLRGNISCTNLTVEGTVTGNEIVASQNISISRGGRVTSNITCSGLNISENSIFNGTCNMKYNKDPISEIKRDDSSSAKKISDNLQAKKAPGDSQVKQAPDILQAKQAPDILQAKKAPGNLSSKKTPDNLPAN